MEFVGAVVHYTYFQGVTSIGDWGLVILAVIIIVRFGMPFLNTSDSAHLHERVCCLGRWVINKSDSSSTIEVVPRLRIFLGQRRDMYDGRSVQEKSVRIVRTSSRVKSASPQVIHDTTLNPPPRPRLRVVHINHSQCAECTLFMSAGNDHRVRGCDTRTSNPASLHKPSCKNDRTTRSTVCTVFS